MKLLYVAIIFCFSTSVLAGGGSEGGAHTIVPYFNCNVGITNPSSKVTTWELHRAVTYGQEISDIDYRHYGLQVSEEGTPMIMVSDRRTSPGAPDAVAIGGQDSVGIVDNQNIAARTGFGMSIRCKKTVSLTVSH